MLLLLLLLTAGPLLLLLLLLLLLSAATLLLLLLLLLLLTARPLLLLLLLLLLLSLPEVAAGAIATVPAVPMVAEVLVAIAVPVTASASRAVPRDRRPDDLLGRAGGVGRLRLNRDRDDEGRSRHDGSSQCFFEHGYPSVGSVTRRRMTSEFTELESIHRTLDLDPDSHAKGSKRLSHPSRGKQAFLATQRIQPENAGLSAPFRTGRRSSLCQDLEPIPPDGEFHLPLSG
ncbi:hypothetical protein [Microbispora hainanensis]|uniref:Uncharacterized protein n=1 Tax=Microbispora hainanensis TaxID=568844 RepID=A0A544YRU6_9ACTN|nr:hypothetical protein [Microbispora hainanensis]TQS19511.1 hypothetical protein FLX08_19710 [Microbispora hainanensis]